jgi:hypothetical protein
MRPSIADGLIFLYSNFYFSERRLMTMLSTLNRGWINTDEVPVRPAYDLLIINRKRRPGQAIWDVTVDLGGTHAFQEVETEDVTGYVEVDQLNVVVKYEHHRWSGSCGCNIQANRKIGCLGRQITLPSELATISKSTIYARPDCTGGTRYLSIPSRFFEQANNLFINEGWVLEDSHKQGAYIKATYSIPECPLLHECKVPNSHRYYPVAQLPAIGQVLPDQIKSDNIRFVAAAAAGCIAKTMNVNYPEKGILGQKPGYSIAQISANASCEYCTHFFRIFRDNNDESAERQPGLTEKERPLQFGCDCCSYPELMTLRDGELYFDNVAGTSGYYKSEIAKAAKASVCSSYDWSGHTKWSQYEHGDCAYFTDEWTASRAVTLVQNSTPWFTDLRAGQALGIPTDKGVILYKSEPGETLDKVADKFHTSIDDIIQANSLPRVTANMPGIRVHQLLTDRLVDQMLLQKI